MNFTTVRFYSLMAAIVFTWACEAQEYPAKPVRMIVPLAAGGPLDVVTRAFAAPLSEHFGQSFVVENRVGASGNIGVDAVARAQPDGYTLLWVLDSMLTVNPIFSPSYGEPLERLRPITMLTETPATLVIHPSVGVKTIADFVKASQVKTLFYASSGVGTSGHRYVEFFKSLTGARISHVPYKGNAPAVQSLLTGETQAFITPISSVLPLIRAGKLVPLAVTSAKRNALLPDSPSMVELGYDRFVTSAWISVLAPAKTPQPVVDILHRTIVRIMQTPEMQALLTKRGVEPTWNDAKAIINRASIERKIWAEIIEKTGMKGDDS